MRNPRCKPHNAFTNHEVELIRTHWPSKMPLAELLAMLPRHTQNSVTGYANKVLGLTRPHVKKSKPAWERMRVLLEGKPMSQVELAAEMGISRARVSEIIRDNRSDVYLSSWRWPEKMGRAEALWSLGKLADAIEPMGAQRARQISRRRVNPFLAAAGLVEVPNGVRGRVYRDAETMEHAA